MHALPTRLYFIMVCGFLAANISIYQILFTPHVLTVSVLEGRKGSAVLLRSPRDKTLLINTGSDARILRTLGTTLPPWRRTIDAVILTDTKAGSVGELPDIERHYHIQTRVDVGGASTPYGTDLSFDKNILITVISADTFSISNGATALLISSSTPPGTYTLVGS